MNLLRSIVAAFSTFSRIPTPRVRWDGGGMRYMLCAFPLVGAVIGALTLGYLRLSAALDFGASLRGAGLALIPVLVTGGIHLDGFCDTADALSSRQPPERKREILKDPRAGAFAVIGTASYLLAYFALCCELSPARDASLLYALGFMVSRCLSGLASVFFGGSGKTGLLASMRGAADKRAAAATLPLLLALCVCAMLLINPVSGGAMLTAAGLSAVYLRVMSRRQFGGMSGDLAGFFLQLCELVMLLALVLAGKIAPLLG